MVAKSPIDAALDRAGGSSYYYAHTRRDTDDLAAPMPPIFGTKIENGENLREINDAAVVPGSSRLSSKSDYYYAHAVSDTTSVSEPRAPMPPGHGTLLKTSHPAKPRAEPEPMREYYFEDADRSKFIVVTFPLQRVGATHKRGAAARQRAKVDAERASAEGRISSEDPDARGDGVYVSFGDRNSRSFEVEVRGHVDEEHDPDNPYEPEPVVRHLRFRCERTFDEFVADKSEWKVYRNSIKVRLFKNPEGPNKYRAWRRVLW